jgi:hypothetical protein
MKIKNFKSFTKNTLLGFFDVELDSGLVLCGCTLHQTGGRHWIGLPSKPYTKDDGTQSWTKIVDFRDKKIADKFQETVTPLAIAANEGAPA